MLTDRGKLLLIASLPLWLISRSFGIPEVSVAALACVALVGVAVVYTRVASVRVAARRRVQPNRLFYDASARVTLDIRNDGRLATAVMEVDDAAPRALTEQPDSGPGPASFVLHPLPSGRSVQLSYELHARLRGHYEIGPLSLSLRDPFGVAQRRVRFTRTEQLVVYPPIWALPSVLPQVGRVGTTTEGSAKPPAPYGEFANIREYVRGDDLRKVHWKTTAHRGKLMVRQEEAPEEAVATILLDTRRRHHLGTGPHATFEHAVAAAASAAYQLADAGYGLRLVTGPVNGTARPLTWRLALEELAALQPRRGESFLPVWRQLERGRAGEGLLLTILPPPDDADLHRLVRAGRVFGARAAVFVGPRRHRRMDRRAAEAVPALRAAGWHVATHHVGERLDTSWEQLARRPERVEAV